MDKRQILLIDGETEKCEIFLSALQRLNGMFKCSFIPGNNETVRSVKRIMPDFIFYSLKDAGQNNFGCLAAIKKDKTLRHIPFFLYASSLDEGTVRKATEMGALKLIRKPKDPRTLSKVLKGLFFQSMRAEVRNYAPRYND